MIERVLIDVEGIVQGVGFRPFVYNLATALHLCGFVQNNASGVHIDVEGAPEAINDFLHRLITSPPPLAAIDRVSSERAPARHCERFAIAPSGPALAPQTLVSPDVATCDLCLRELFDPENRRYRYPFINCTHCGPRFTIVHDVPYDRPRTTMSLFTMCEACQQEYENPSDRRFHAQPIACWACGPILGLRARGHLNGPTSRACTARMCTNLSSSPRKPGLGAAAAAAARPSNEASPLGRSRSSLVGLRPPPAELTSCGRNAKRRWQFRLRRSFVTAQCSALSAQSDTRDPSRTENRELRTTRILQSESALSVAVAALLDGQIVAVKGIGGYHLACDATSAPAVCRLRRRKHREAKPLAIMVGDLAMARTLCEVNERAAALLMSPQRPIVLLKKRSHCGVAEEVAPGNRYLGLMLPYAPLQSLLLAGVGRPLVMTSGNRTDEPIAFEDGDAFGQLAEIADLFLTHDRPIETRCDDSVMRVVRERPTFLRRSRGFAPQPVRLRVPFAVPVLAMGGHLKNTFCFGKGAHAFLSHHIGDLENVSAYCALKAGIAHYSRLFDVHPEIVAHDLHPDYLSTQLAVEFDDAERLAVQHHHAHVASCMAEHGITEPVIGVAFDGAGLGPDGAIWGGEFLVVDDAGYERLAHLAYVPLPGGDAAARQPWRMAAAHLWAAHGREMERLPIPFLEHVAPGQWSLLRQMLARGINCPATSSVGRLFDAVAALVGIRRVAQYEAQPAMELEMAADPDTDASYPVEFRETGDRWIVETAPLIQAVVDDISAGRSAAEIAGAFHNAVRDFIVEVVERIRWRTGLNRVALTGGVFQNAMLAERAADGLARRGFEVLLHQRVPCNDGGLSLGQAFVAGREPTTGARLRAAELAAQGELCA